MNLWDWKMNCIYRNRASSNIAWTYVLSVSTYTLRSLRLRHLRNFWISPWRRLFLPPKWIKMFLINTMKQDELHCLAVYSQERYFWHARLQSTHYWTLCFQNVAPCWIYVLPLKRHRQTTFSSYIRPNYYGPIAWKLSLHKSRAFYPLDLDRVVETSSLAEQTRLFCRRVFDSRMFGFFALRNLFTKISAKSSKL